MAVHWLSLALPLATRTEFIQAIAALLQARARSLRTMPARESAGGGMLPASGRVPRPPRWIHAADHWAQRAHRADWAHWARTLAHCSRSPRLPDTERR